MIISVLLFLSAVSRLQGECIYQAERLCYVEAQVLPADCHGGILPEVRTVDTDGATCTWKCAPLSGEVNEESCSWTRQGEWCLSRLKLKKTYKLQRGS